MRTLIYSFAILLLIAPTAACKSTHDTIAPVTKPAGAVVAAPQAVTQGVAEGYADQAGTTVNNPYGR